MWIILCCLIFKLGSFFYINFQQCVQHSLLCITTELLFLKKKTACSILHGFIYPLECSLQCLGTLFQSIVRYLMHCDIKSVDKIIFGAASAFRILLCLVVFWPSAVIHTKQKRTTMSTTMVDQKQEKKNFHHPHFFYKRQYETKVKSLWIFHDNTIV